MFFINVIAVYVKNEMAFLTSFKNNVKNVKSFDVLWMKIPLHYIYHKCANA